MPSLSRAEYKKLEREWDKRLADSGFFDIEDRKSEGAPLKAWHSSYFQCRYTPCEFEAKREYYERAQSYLYEAFFDTDTLDYFGVVDREREVWELHATGMSIRDIAAALGFTKFRVETIVSALTERMLKR